jgi:hypothetical protein
MEIDSPDDLLVYDNDDIKELGKELNFNVVKRNKLKKMILNMKVKTPKIGGPSHFCIHMTILHKNFFKNQNFSFSELIQIWMKIFFKLRKNTWTTIWLFLRKFDSKFHKTDQKHIFLLDIAKETNILSKKDSLIQIYTIFSKESLGVIGVKPLWPLKHDPWPRAKGWPLAPDPWTPGVRGQGSWFQGSNPWPRKTLHLGFKI